MNNNKSFNVDEYNRLMDGVLVAEGSLDNISLISSEIRGDIESFSSEFEKISSDEENMIDEETYESINKSITGSGEGIDEIESVSQSVRIILFDLYQSLHEAANLLLENDEQEKLKGSEILKNIDKSKISDAKKKIEPALYQALEYLRNLRTDIMNVIEVIQHKSSKLRVIADDFIESFNREKIFSMENCLLLTSALFDSIVIALDKTVKGQVA